MSTESTFNSRVGQFRLAMVTIVFLLLIGGVGGVAVWQSELPIADTDAPVGLPASSRLVNVSVQQGRVTLACPPGVIDPNTSTQTENKPQVLASAVADAFQLEGGGTALQIPSKALEKDSFVAAQLSAEPAGDLASLLLETCVVPARDQTMAFGATEVGQSSVLVLSNPGPKPVETKVQVLTELGPALPEPTTITVPSRSTITTLPAVWAPGETRIGVRVQADGLGVAAWLQNSKLDGELPNGLTRVSGSEPAQKVTLVGLDASAATSLRIANLGSEETGVTVSALSASGSTALGGTDQLTVEPMGVFDLQLTGLPEGTFALSIEADQPVTASVLHQYKGNPFEADKKLNVGLTSVVGSSHSFDHGVAPELATILDAIKRLGLDPGEAQLVLANPGPATAKVTVGSKVTELNPGTATSVEYPTGDKGKTVSIDSDHPIYAAVQVRATGRSGLVTSIMAIQQDAASSADRQVVVFPAGN